jgi:hypothetical protein
MLRDTPRDGSQDGFRQPASEGLISTVLILVSHNLLWGVNAGDSILGMALSCDLGSDF